jgi:hypothetical protein
MLQPDPEVRLGEKAMRALGPLDQAYRGAGETLAKARIFPFIDLFESIEIKVI